MTAFVTFAAALSRKKMKIGMAVRSDIGCPFFSVVKHNSEWHSTSLELMGLKQAKAW